ATLVLFGPLGIVTARGLAWWSLILPIAGSARAHDGSLTRFMPRRLGVLRTLLTGPSPSMPPRAVRRSPLNAIVALLLILVGVAIIPAWRPVGPTGVPAGTLSFAPQAL